MIRLDDETMVVDKGLFYAAEVGVTVGVEMQKNLSSALMGGEGLFQTKLTGTGIVVLATPVHSAEILRYQLDGDKLSVDGNFALLRKGDIEFKVERSAKTLLGSMTSGEGMLQTFTGTGEVWLAPTQAVYQQIKGRAFGGLAGAGHSMGTNTKKRGLSKFLSLFS
jgi:uncharacterized protein (AIM24 family)